MQVREYSNPEVPWIITSKGIEEKTLLLPSEIITDTLGYQPAYMVCMGPSFARDLVNKKKTGFVIAVQSTELQKNGAALFTNDYISTDFSTDIIGLQLCAAFKNVVALLVGISDGNGNGDNARALLVTRCFQKMIELVIAAGGTLETVHGLGGFGDLFLTASSTQSRNYNTGKALGTGEPIESIIKRTGFTPESLNTARSIVDYARKYEVDLGEIKTILNII